ncbi:MAG: winged helix-turn-helix domain-containing protein [bacterium]|nr:winged helix-turn-helix domain-containing protein [bacterium]
MASAVQYSPIVPMNGSNTVRLTRKERDLLAFLRENAGRCLSRDLLLSKVWGYREGVKSRTLDVHVQRLRKKLGPEQGARILTVFRGGYLWSPDDGTVGGMAHFPQPEQQANLPN